MANLNECQNLAEDTFSPFIYWNNDSTNDNCFVYSSCDTHQPDNVDTAFTYNMHCGGNLRHYTVIFHISREAKAEALSRACQKKQK